MAISIIWIFYSYCLAFVLYMRKRSLWFLMTGLIIIATIPTIASNSETGFAALRSALIYPLFIMLIGLGISHVFFIYKHSRYRLTVSVLLFFLYLFQIFNFINIYFFRNPIYNSQAYDLSSRIVSKYVSLAEKN